MKKKIFVCLAAFALALSLCACGVGGSQNAGFSTNRWGDDMETVLAALDGERFLPIDNVIVVMDTEVEGLTGSAIYTVDKEKGLTSIGYLFDDLQNPVADYDALKDAITQAHGKPDTDVVEEMNSTAASVSEDQALKYGYVTYKTEWTTKSETVFMAMSRNNDGKIGIMCNFDAAGAAQG